MNKKTAILLSILGALVVISGASVLVSRQKTELASDDTSQTQTEVGEFTNNPESMAATPDTNSLRAGGSSYTDSQANYTFLYPNDYTLDDQDPQHIRIYKRGETQRPQSEISDGALLVFESIDLNGQTLEELVDSRIIQATADGTSEVIQPKTATTLGSYQGFAYELRGLGSSTNLILQKNQQSTTALSVTFMVSDPQQKGYAAEINAILSTIELHK